MQAGPVAAVTGGASGIGRAIAVKLASEAIAVAVVDVDGEGGRAVAAEITRAGGRGWAIECDVADAASVRRARDEVLSAAGVVDILVNNAGFDKPGFFLDTDPESWDRLVAVTLGGTLNCTHAFGSLIAQRARERGYGRIVNIASEAARSGALGEAVYSAAKGGVVAFSKSMARELARDGVTVNAICPGPSDTPMTEKIRATPLGAKLMERMIAVTPLRRLALPEEVAAAVAYFVSPDAGFVTGQVLSVSGGLTMSG